jgi:hypothetical protein
MRGGGSGRDPHPGDTSARRPGRHQGRQRDRLSAVCFNGLEHEACDVRAEIEQQLGLFRPAGDRRGVAFVSAIAADVPEWLWLARKQVRQLLVNLVGNAVKFTSEGTITVEARIEPRTPSGVFCVLRVIVEQEAWRRDLIGREGAGRGAGGSMARASRL